MISTNVSTSDVQNEFSKVGLSKVSPDMLSQCVSLAKSLRLSPKQMAECWELLILNKNLETLDDLSFPSFKNELIKIGNTSELPPEALTSGAVVTRPALNNNNNNNKRKSPAVTPPASSKQKTHATLDGPVTSMVASSATLSAVSSALTRSSSSAVCLLTTAPPNSFAEWKAKALTSSNIPKYEERNNAGKIEVTLNKDLPVVVVTPAATTQRRCSVSYDEFDTNVKESYRHYFTTLEERAKALDRHLIDFGKVLADRYGLVSSAGDGEEQSSATTAREDNAIAGLEAVGIPRQETICCIGRICNAAHEGKLNTTTVLLEGSRHESGGMRVELDLSHLISSKTPFSLFAGQIVAAEGMNTSGRKMVAHRICEGAAQEPMKSTVQQLLRYHHDDDCQGGSPLRILSVCGPYTTLDNLEFAPLTDLLALVSKERPDAVILAGPFVDINHPAVACGQTVLQFQDGGEITVPYETFFANKIAALIEDLFSDVENLPTQFVLVPSLEDATAEWVYPQPPMVDRIKGGKAPSFQNEDAIDIGTLGLNHIETAGRDGGKGRKRVHCVSNPCTFKINEVVIGVTSTDVLFHMNLAETNANLERGTRMGRISQHMLQQRNYYPIFPADLSVNADLKFMEQWSMPCRPDVLILPSRLNTFAQSVLDSTIVINPGYLARGTTGGTYASIEIHPYSRDELERAGGDEVEMEHRVQERVRVEIKRI